jgi:hypothetical protein
MPTSTTKVPIADIGPADPGHLTIEYTANDGGWVTAQIVEIPAAISQGPTRHDAYLNVLDALHDLTHEPTISEAMAFTAQARIVEPLVGLRDRLARATGRRRRARPMS